MTVCVQLHRGNENLKATQENAVLYAFFKEKGLSLKYGIFIIILVKSHRK